MCDPVSASLAASAVLGAGGSVVNGMETANTQRKQVEARNAATNAELARQKGYQATSTGQFNSGLDRFSPTNQADALATGQQGAASLFHGNAPTAAQVGTLTTGNAPAVVGANENARLANAFAVSGGHADNLAKLTGYDQQMLGNQQDLVSTGRNLDTTANFARQSAAVGSKEADAAYNNTFKTNSGLGDMLTLAGNLVGSRTGVRPGVGAPVAAPVVYAGGAPQ